MASKTVVDAVKARLAANWSAVPLLEDNVDTAGPDDGGPYLELQFPVANERQITVGAPGRNVFREEGAFRLVLAIRTGDPLDQALAWIEQLRALFRSKQFGGVTTWAPSPAVTDDRAYVAGGTRVLLSTSVPYYADLFA
jgi:hypothetical protein